MLVVSKTNDLRRPVPCTSTGGSRSPTLTDGVRTAQLLSHVLSETLYDIRCRSLVAFCVFLGPSCKCNPRLECVERETAFVE